MDINQTKQMLKEIRARSEEIRNGFDKMTHLAPQIIEEEKFTELRDDVMAIADNFHMSAVWLYTFGRMGITSNNWCPTNRYKPDGSEMHTLDEVLKK